MNNNENEEEDGHSKNNKNNDSSSKSLDYSQTAATSSSNTVEATSRSSQKRILDSNDSSTNLAANAEPSSELEIGPKRPKTLQDINNNTSENENVNLNDAKNGEKPKTPAQKTRVKFTDPQKDEYWSNIRQTRVHKEKTLKFYDLVNREFGYSKTASPQSLFFNLNGSSSRFKQNARDFIDSAVSSLSHVRRMKLLHSLSYHDGCVNSLNFNRIGTMLCSGSDDFQINVYDWTRNALILSFDSGHKSNVFQTKFMPFTGDSQIVSCARDGQIRLALISSSGSHIGTKKLAKHADSCHKLSIEYDSSNMFLSAGEDGVVFELDLRQQSPANILTVKSAHRSSSKLPLYSIATNPTNTFQFCVSGRDQYIRVYDKRMLVNEPNKMLKMFSPLHMKDLQRCSVTSALYNHDGTEIIGSYSDEDIYLFQSEKDEKQDAKYRYSGHRNSDTIKGVNFYGAQSEYIISGSDCGRIFFWEKESQQIVNYLKGDEHGIVNVLEPHPNFPILATSGLDNDVKIWSPEADEPNKMHDLSQIINENQRHRETNRHFSLSTFEFELLLLLMRRPNSRVGFLSRRNANLDRAESEREESESESDREFRLRRRFLNLRGLGEIEDENEADNDEDVDESEESDNYFDYEYEDEDESETSETEEQEARDEEEEESYFTDEGDTNLSDALGATDNYNLNEFDDEETSATATTTTTTADYDESNRNPVNNDDNNQENC